MILTGLFLPGNSDFTEITNQDVGPFSNTQRQQCFLVAITNSQMIAENSENFFLNLTTRPGEVLQQVTINPAVAEITIMDSDCESIGVPDNRSHTIFGATLNLLYCSAHWD